MEKSLQNQIILEKRVGESVIKSTPRVSIVIPAYNVAEYIAETLDSVLVQTFSDYETIIVNDGSQDTEKLEKILAAYFDKIVYIRQKNSGASVARNTAIENARGEFIAFLDGDDIWLPEKLASQMKFLESGNFDMVYCDAILFGESISKYATFMEKSPSSGKVTPESLLNATCNVITSGTIVKKNWIIEHGMFDEKSFRAQDFDLWFRLSKNNIKIGYQKDVMLKYRVRADGLTGDSVEKCQRDINSLKMVGGKYKLTASEQRVWETSLKMYEAELNLEKGKHNLVERNFAEARKNFADANIHQQKFKLKVIDFLIAVNPRLVLLLFKKFRQEEFLHIPPQTDEQ